MSQWDQDRNCWSGLGSANNFNWQEGLRNVCQEVGQFQFHSSMSGYDGWLRVATSARARKPKRMWWLGHSNGGYATTAGAAFLADLDIEHVIVCFDRTLKSCPPVGKNVVAVLDLWAGLENIKRGPDFNGVLIRKDYSQYSHIGVIGAQEAQQEAIEFLREWGA